MTISRPQLGASTPLVPPLYLAGGATGEHRVGGPRGAPPGADTRAHRGGIGYHPGLRSPGILDGTAGRMSWQSKSSAPPPGYRYGGRYRASRENVLRTIFYIARGKPRSPQQTSRLCLVRNTIDLAEFHPCRSASCSIPQPDNLTRSSRGSLE